MRAAKSTSTADDWLRENAWRIVGLLTILLIAVALFRWWTRPPAVEFDNLKYLQLLTTAVSSRNSDWLNKVDGALQQRLSTGELSDREWRAFQPIIDTARRGTWEQADRDCYALAEAQLNRRRSKPASDAHDLLPD